MELAPIALFVYKRPFHTEKVLNALKNNALAKDSDLFVFADGLKDTASTLEHQQHKAVQDLVNNIEGFKNVTVIASDTNKGLAKSITSGVSQLINSYGSVIVIEDDIVTGTGFLTYMNKGLDLYRDNDKVISIHGYSLPIKTAGIKDTTFFLKGADCWGWATWKRGWDIFNDDTESLLKQLRSNNLQHSFDLDGSYPYTQMLQDVLSGKIDSWAIKWHASAFLENKLTLHPKVSIVQNIGFDGSGTHCGEKDGPSHYVNDCPIHDIPVEENKKALAQIINYYRREDLAINRFRRLFFKSARLKKIIRGSLPPYVRSLYHKLLRK